MQNVLNERNIGPIAQWLEYCKFGNVHEYFFFANGVKKTYLRR